MKECKNCKRQGEIDCQGCVDKNRYLERRRWDDIAIDEGKIRS